MRAARPAPLLLAIFVAGALAAASAGADEAPSITPEALEAKLGQKDAPVVLDVRTEAEFTSGHIPGALHVPHAEVAQRRDQLPKDRDVAVYCGVGPRARLAEQALRSAGVTRLLHVEGGFTAWKRAGLPIALP